MKIFYLIIVLIFSTNLNAQNTFKFKSGSRVLYNDVKINSDSVRSLLNSNKKALELYNTGMTKKTFGNILL